MYRVKADGIIRQGNYSRENQEIEGVKLIDQEHVFTYVTRQGSIVVEDSRAKSSSQAQSLSVTQRGLLSSMLLSHNKHTLYIGTMQGYLLAYDFRCNLIQDVLQLDRQQPITSIQHFPNPLYANQISLSISDDFHSLAVFDLTNLSQNILPLLSFLSDPLAQSRLHSTPFLVNKLSNQKFINYHQKYRYKTNNLLNLHLNSHSSLNNF